MLPYDRSRRYLTGIDWLMNGLDRLGRLSTGIGSYSNAILDLDGIVSESAFADALLQIAARFPLLHGRVARDNLNLAPYWQLHKSPVNTIPFRVIQLMDGADAESENIFADDVNTPFGSEFSHVRLTLVHLGDRRSRVGMVFDHRLFDAFGAETFLRLIDCTARGELGQIAPQVSTTEPPHLDLWPRRLASGRKLNRLIFKIAKDPICALKIPAPGTRRRVRFVHDRLTVAESSALTMKSVGEIGVPIILPSVIARAMTAMHATIPNTALSGTRYTVFTSAGSRSAAAAWRELFFNHFSILPFSAPRTLLTATRDLAQHLRDAFFQLVHDDIGLAMSDATMLARIVPRRLSPWLMEYPFSGRLCTLYFACLRETGFTLPAFLGARVRNLYHKPLAFAPPGVNLCMTQFAGAFNLVLSYVDGVMRDEDAAKMLDHFKLSLVGPN